ncbi:hypothetical protein P5V15_010139 [Pogonomyrmex californicus]
MYKGSSVNYYTSIQQNELNKYLDIGINVGPVSYVELCIGNNRGNQILLSYQLVQSIASLLSIHDLIIELVQMRNTNIVRFILRDTSLYMKSLTVFFLFELEHCVEHVYYWLYENIYGVSEKFKQFINFLRRNYITDKHIAIKTLRESDIFDKTSIIDCELLAYAIDNIVHYALHDQ